MVPTDSAIQRMEAGADAGVAPPPEIIPTDPGETLLDYPGLGSPARPGVSYVLDGVPVDVNFAIERLNSGAAAQCPNNDCGPRWNGNGFSIWNPATGWAPLGHQGGQPPTLRPHGASPSGIGPGHRNPFGVGDEGDDYLPYDLLPHLEHGGTEQLPPCPPVPDAPTGTVSLGGFEANLQVSVDADIKEALDMRDFYIKTALHEDLDNTGLAALATWFFNKVKPGGPWDYKLWDPASIRQEKHSKYEPFGNFVYGATGLAAGFSAGQLERLAGYFQTATQNAKGINPGIVMSILGVGGESPYGDEPWDNDDIKRGMAYYRRKFVLKDCQ